MSFRSLRFGRRPKSLLCLSTASLTEEDESGSNRQAISFFYIAKGSSAGLLTQVTIAHEIGYVEKDQFEQIRDECQAIS